MLIESVEIRGRIQEILKRNTELLYKIIKPQGIVESRLMIAIVMPLFFFNHLFNLTKTIAMHIGFVFIDAGYIREVVIVGVVA